MVVPYSERRVGERDKRTFCRNLGNTKTSENHHQLFTINIIIITIIIIIIIMIIIISINNIFELAMVNWSVRLDFSSTSHRGGAPQYSHRHHPFTLYSYCCSKLKMVSDEHYHLEMGRWSLEFHRYFPTQIAVPSRLNLDGDIIIIDGTWPS